MIQIKIHLDKEYSIQKIEIKGHASTKESFSVECAAISTIAELMIIAFEKNFINSKVKKDKGFLEILVLEKNEKIKERIDDFMFPIIALLNNISETYKQTVQFDLITK